MLAEPNQSPGQRLRSLIEAGPVLAPIVWDAGQARFAAEAGNPAVYMTGFGTASTFGLPDIGLLGLEEMAANSGRIAAAVDVPVIADADTGYGNAVNVAHTVERYEAAGVAALHIEDQVSPKRCGAMAGKDVVPTNEMVQKIRAAVDARQDPALMIIARTDSLGPLGWDAAMERSVACHDSGADLIVIDGLRERADVERAAEQLPEVPRMLIIRDFPIEDAGALGYRVVVHWGTLLAIYGAMRDVYRELATTHTVDLESRATSTTHEIQDTMGVSRYLDLDQAAAVPSIHATT